MEVFDQVKRDAARIAMNESVRQSREARQLVLKQMSCSTGFVLGTLDTHEKCIAEIQRISNADLTPKNRSLLLYAVQLALSALKAERNPNAPVERAKAAVPVRRRR